MPAKTNDKKPAKKRAKKAPKIAQKQKQNQTVMVTVNATAPRVRPRARPRQPQASGPKPTPSISNYNFPNSSQPYHNSPWSSLDNGRHFGSGQSQQQQTAFINMFTGQMQRILNPFMEQMRQTQEQPQATAPVEQGPVDQQQNAPQDAFSQPMDVEPETAEAAYSRPVGNEPDTGPGIKTEPNSQPMDVEPETAESVFTTTTRADSRPNMNESESMDVESESVPGPPKKTRAPRQNRDQERGGIGTKPSDSRGVIIASPNGKMEEKIAARIAKRLGNNSGLKEGDTIDMRNWNVKETKGGGVEYFNNNGVRWNLRSGMLSLDTIKKKSGIQSTQPEEGGAESAPIENTRPKAREPAAKRSRPS